MPSCCSYCHYSTGSNSHTVVLPKPASYSPCSIVLCPRKNTRTRLLIFYCCIQYRESTAVVQLQYVIGCSKSTIKVRQKYVESKAYVQLKCSKSTVKCGKSTVLYENFFWAPPTVSKLCAASINFLFLVKLLYSSGQIKFPQWSGKVA